MGCAVSIPRLIHQTWKSDRVPAGYVLLTAHDLPGHDRSSVEVPEGSHDAIVAACERDAGAVAFNYNGFVKARGSGRIPDLRREHLVQAGHHAVGLCEAACPGCRAGSP
jgi:hypothetical protein